MKRLYLDTSVFGGYFDAEFAKWSRPLIDQILDGRFILVLSYHTVRELEKAPAHVRELVDSVPDSVLDFIYPSPAVDQLREAYLAAGFISRRWGADAEHIAIASLSGVDLIASWNFKHIVNMKRIHGFHAVNRSFGLPEVPIVTPLEVLDYD